ncbi:hypothetical protein MNBD_GAMMA08-1545 [hydrothermal vent metagenome]|uniref:Uncharacterized protein n=1 Tax=hydrothermal vent metagenome TaxID=652676 RepID=A0A3B0X2H3_9ZZZZ
MSMSTQIYGIVPPNDEWKKMKAVFDACCNAEIDIPADVWDYFEGEVPPDSSGIMIDIEDNDCVSEYNSDSCHGYEIDIGKLDPKIKTIRFVNSY